MNTAQIENARYGTKITIKSIRYTIIQASSVILWLKRENGDRIYRTAYYVKNEKIFVKGLPK
jgi:hypothetical protein